jgi:hypothetical protein
MIRPVLRYPYDIFVGSDNIGSLSRYEINVFPNPADQRIQFHNLNRDNVTNWVIFDVQGKEVLKGVRLGEMVDIGSLGKGFYVLGVWFKDGGFGSARFCVSGDEF